MKDDAENIRLAGQGMWIWQLPETAGGDPERLAQEARRLGLGHVLIKAADGTARYRRNASADARAAERLRAAGIQVAGWGFHYGREPEAEARTAAQACEEIGYDIYVLNAEGDFEIPQGPERARRFIDGFRELTGGRVALGLSTFALPELHPAFPYAACLEGVAACGFVLPQVYTIPSRTRPCLNRTISYLEKAREQLAPFGKPVVPTLRAYTGDGQADWSAIVRDAQDFLAAPAEVKGPAWNWWVWQSAEKHGPMWELLREEQSTNGAKRREARSGSAE